MSLTQKDTRCGAFIGVTHSGPGLPEVFPTSPPCVRKGESTGGNNRLTGSFPAVQSLQVHLPQNSHPAVCTGDSIWDSIPPKPFKTKDALLQLLHPSHNMLPFAPIDAPFSLRPMKIVERADGLMQHAHVLYEHYEHVMRPIDRTLAEDRMSFATDIRHGVEEKCWLSQTEQANLYSGRAQEALETVKRFVDEAIVFRGRDNRDGLLVPVP